METAQPTGVIGMLRTRLQRVLEREGIQGVLVRLAPHLFSRPLHHKGYLITLPLVAKVHVPKPAVDVDVRPLTLGEHALLDELAEMNEFGNTREELVERLNLGELCFAAIHAGRIVSYSWMSFRDFPVTYLSRTFPLNSDEVYYYDAYTLERYRGMGMNPYLNALSARRIAEIYGKRYLVGFMRVRNKAGMRSLSERGVLRISTAGYLKLFGFRFHYYLKDRVL